MRLFWLRPRSAADNLKKSNHFGYNEHLRHVGAGIVLVIKFS